MQIIRRYLAGIIVVVCLLSSLFSMQSRQVAVYLPMQVNTEMEKRACWISYIDMESELSDKSEAAFRAKVHAMYDTVKRYGLNTVIVHARAMRCLLSIGLFSVFRIYVQNPDISGL